MQAGRTLSQALPGGRARGVVERRRRGDLRRGPVGLCQRPARAALDQGLTLIHFSAQLERFCGIGGARRGCVARVKGV